jgi:hypothetical protein
MDKRQVLSILGLLLALVFATGTDDTNTGTKTDSSTVDLHASVTFTGSQFIITNLDNFDWTDVKLEVNPQTFSSGYTLHADVIRAGSVYTVGAMQFADSGGERFNPFTHKPQKFSVWCDTPGGKKGFYYAGWGD